MVVEHNNTTSGWKYLDHLKFAFNNIGQKREFDCVNKNCSLEFFKNVYTFQGKLPFLSNIVEFQSPRLK
jgi:hypothetical protein